MKRITKINIFCIVFFLAINSNIFSLGAGFQISAVPGLSISQDNIKTDKMTSNITGTFSLSRIPLTIGSGIDIGKLNSEFGYGISFFGDFKAADFQITNLLNLYSGFGSSIKFVTSNFKDYTLTAGARFFAGLNRFFYDGYLELYFQQNIVPSYLKNLQDSNSKPGFMLYLPFESGLRLHF